MVFCQVEGEEGSGHIGSRESAKVDSQSKFNQTEAGKIVSINHIRTPIITSCSFK